MPIYTRTGDKGETSLFGGKRVSKSDALVDAYGSVDELNSWIGMVAAALPKSEKKEFLHKIQADLFTIGGALAGWKDADLSILPARVTEMEVEIDVMEKELPELNTFILPGGSVAGAHVHVTRSVCRRAERLLVALFQKQTVNPDIIQYLNRLSDLFFQLARFINKNAGAVETQWKGINRPAINNQTKKRKTV